MFKQVTISIHDWAEAFIRFFTSRGCFWHSSWSCSLCFWFPVFWLTNVCQIAKFWFRIRQVWHHCVFGIVGHISGGTIVSNVVSWAMFNIDVIKNYLWLVIAEWTCRNVPRRNDGALVAPVDVVVGVTSLERVVFEFIVGVDKDNFVGLFSRWILRNFRWNFTDSDFGCPISFRLFWWNFEKIWRSFVKFMFLWR